MEKFQYQRFQERGTTLLPNTLLIPTKAQDDPVNSPKHYVRGGIEVIEVLEKKMAPEAFKGFLMGNVLKYVLRHEYKNGTEDLKKAAWYLQKLISVLGQK